MRKEIVSRFPTDIERYVEVFGGAGWVLFYQDKYASMEVYNDIDGELVNLFRCFKYHAGELERELGYYLNSRELFEDVKARLTVRGQTDIQRAAQFYIRSRLSFGAAEQSFCCRSKNISVDEGFFKTVQQRLKGVVIERKDFADLIQVYDRPRALFYVDPPYHGTEGYYTNSFSDADHRRLRECLGQIKGRFLLSYNDDEYVRDLYTGYTMEVVSRSHSLTNTNGTSRVFHELVIRNY